MIQPNNRVILPPRIARLAALGAIVFLGGIGPALFAETPPDYSATEAGKHVGETATVTDKVTSVHQSQGGSIFLNLSGVRPNEPFTIFIPASSAANFPNTKQYNGATLTVSGKITTHHDKPQIVATEASQITVKEPAETSKSESGSKTDASPSPSATP